MIWGSATKERCKILSWNGPKKKVGTVEEECFEPLEDPRWAAERCVGFRGRTLCFQVTAIIFHILLLFTIKLNDGKAAARLTATHQGVKP